MAPTPRMSDTAGNATQAFGSQGRLSGIPSDSKWDPKRNQVLEEELRTSACSGNRDFLHHREMESEAVNVCPDLLDNNPGDRKHFPSKGDFSGWKSASDMNTEKGR